MAGALLPELPVAHEGHDLGIDVQVPALFTGPARDGEIVYETKCLSCHGRNAEGTHKGPSLIPYDRAHHPDGDFYTAVRKGVPEHHWNFGDMPPVRGMSNAEIESIIAYVRTLQAFNFERTEHETKPN